MRRSRYGYLLLALLVVTGLAGTITPTSLSGKERRFAANSFKDTRGLFLNSLTELSKAQLDYKGGHKLSIRQCVYRTTTAEENLWSLLQISLDKPANPDKRPNIAWKDDQLICVMEDQPCVVNSLLAFASTKSRFKTIDDAVESFKNAQADHIKYIKNTTEDLRNHVVQLPVGWVDCYQLCLLISSLSDKSLVQIQKIKLEPHFPVR